MLSLYLKLRMLFPKVALGVLLRKLLVSVL